MNMTKEAAEALIRVQLSNKDYFHGVMTCLGLESMYWAVRGQQVMLDYFYERFVNAVESESEMVEKLKEQLNIESQKMQERWEPVKELISKAEEYLNNEAKARV